ncbi:MAG: hypothetical protein CK425_01010 [Parachlamydia sp.]|nr:MAG: hypothetical protein CK425_01010 [Parachlamydia sp.]
MLFPSLNSKKILTDEDHRNVSKILLQKTLHKVQFKNEMDQKNSFFGEKGTIKFKNRFVASSFLIQKILDKCLLDFHRSITLIQSLTYLHGFSY